MKQAQTKVTGDILSKLLRISSKKVGLAPGSVVHVGRQKMDKTLFYLLDYSQKKVVEKKLKTVEESFPFKDKPTNTWLDVIGIHDVENIIKLGNEYELHALIQEDIANTGQRPSFEEYPKHIFMTLKMLSLSDNDQLVAEHVSLVFGKGYIISFQEREGDVFESVRNRIREQRKITQRGSDYLTYALIDAIVDHYFIVLEKIGEKIEAMDDELSLNPTQETLIRINRIKRDLIFVRKQVWPLREVLNQFKRVESDLVKEETVRFINDVYDHTVQIIDTIESLRDVVSGMTDLYLSSVSNRMNEIMKVLTIFAAIFIPLTFIAGVYGMNFSYIPELSWKYGYFLIWGVFIIVGVSMVTYFKKQRWM